MTHPPKAFVSHNAADKAVAEEIATALRAKGVEAWFDKWEIAPGDSLIQKVFDDGLKECALFVVLLSPNSISSKWVKYELDLALVRRLEEKTRVVPVVVRECEIPEALKPLRWLSIENGIDQVTGDLADTAHGRWPSRKPAVALPPSPIKSADPEISDYAWAIAEKLVPILLEDGQPGWYGTVDFAEGLDVTELQFSDAIDELEEHQLIEISRNLGSGDEFDLGIMRPTVNVAVRMSQAGRLDFDLFADLKIVAAAIASAGSIVAEHLHKATGLSIARLNLAIDLVENNDIADVARVQGGDFSFYQVDATAKTRRWVRENAN